LQNFLNAPRSQSCQWAMLTGAGVFIIYLLTYTYMWKLIRVVALCWSGHCIFRAIWERTQKTGSVPCRKLYTWVCSAVQLHLLQWNYLLCCCYIFSPLLLCGETFVA